MTITRQDVRGAMARAGYSFKDYAHQDRLSRAFRRVVKGRNFITPDVAGFYRLKEGDAAWVVEISLGDGVQREETLIGVTVVDANMMMPLHERSKAVHSLEELVEYMGELERL